MTHLKDLCDLMTRRITSLRQEAAKLSRQGGASMDYRTSNHLKRLSYESMRKADFLQARLDNLIDLSPSELEDPDTHVTPQIRQLIK